MCIQVATRIKSTRQQNDTEQKNVAKITIENQDKVISKFLLFYLISNFGQKQIKLLSTTTSQPAIITSPINNLNYGIILYGKNRCKKIITQRVV